MPNRLRLWLCRHGWHRLMEPGNCPECGYRYHGDHVADYAEWVRQGARQMSILGRVLQ